MAQENLSVDDKVDKIFNQIGGFGRFQLFAVIAIVLGLSGPNWFWYEVGYLD